MKRLKINDEVFVLSGSFKGKSGKVVSFKGSRVVIDGIGTIKKSTKASEQNPAGGYVDVAPAIHESNVSLYSEKLKRPTRVGTLIKDGKRQRVLKKCNTTL